MADKRMRTDAETIDLVKEYMAVLKKERGGKWTQNLATKEALKKVLLK